MATGSDKPCSKCGQTGFGCGCTFVVGTPEVKAIDRILTKEKRDRIRTDLNCGIDNVSAEETFAILDTCDHLESLLAVAVAERDRALLFIKRSIAYSKPIHGGTQWVAFVGGGMALPQSVFAALGIGEGGT